MTRPASPRPQVTSNARISCATKCPSTRGRPIASVITPENSAEPPTVMGLVGAPNAVIMPASTRSLSCRSALVTWNGMLELSPHAVRPLNVTSVAGVEKRPSEKATPIAVVLIRHVAGNRQVTEARVKAARIGAARKIACPRAGQHVHTRWRNDLETAISGSLTKMAERPFEQIASAPSAGQAQPRHLQEVAERGQIDVFPGGVEPCIGRLTRFPGREYRVLQVRDAAVEVGGGIGDLESIGKPAELAFQIGKSVVELTDLKACDLALEGAGQRTPAFEEMEHAVESSFAGEGVVLFREEELAHALEVDRRLHLVFHLRPVGNVGIAGNDRLRHRRWSGPSARSGCCRRRR